MSIGTLDDQILIDIGEAIRYKNHLTKRYKPREMAEAIRNIEGGGGPPVKIVSWSSGSYEEIKDMIEADREGLINLRDYWTVGDERKVTLSAMPAYDQKTETHVEQQITLVLMDTTCQGFECDIETIGGESKPNFIIGQKNVLASSKTSRESGAINQSATNNGGWKDSLRRKWCNEIYYNALPDGIKDIIKKFKWKQGNGGTSSTGLNETIDYIGLPLEKHIVNESAISQSHEGKLYNQWEYYINISNRVKYCGDDIMASATGYFMGSNVKANVSQFCYYNQAGWVGGWPCDQGLGIAPFMCI